MRLRGSAWAANASASCRPWAICTMAIWRLSKRAEPNATSLSSASSSTQLSSGRTRISASIRATSRATRNSVATPVSRSSSHLTRRKSIRHNSRPSLNQASSRTRCAVPSGPGISAASLPSCPSCSTWFSPMSPSSARRIISSARSRGVWWLISIFRSRLSWFLRSGSLTGSQ
ncbi:hypothetical protein ES703_80335 [subsurface metagenome]